MFTERLAYLIQWGELLVCKTSSACPSKTGSVVTLFYGWVNWGNSPKAHTKKWHSRNLNTSLSNSRVWVLNHENRNHGKKRHKRPFSDRVADQSEDRRSWRGKRGWGRRLKSLGKKTQYTVFSALEGKGRCETVSAGLPPSLSSATPCISSACWPPHFLRMHKKSLLLFLAFADENTCGWTIPDWLRSIHRLRLGPDIQQHHLCRIQNRAP